jgi:hypothetical protein
VSNVESKLQVLKDEYIIDEVRVYSEAMIDKLNGLLKESLSYLSPSHASITELFIELARLCASGAISGNADINRTTTTTVHSKSPQIPLSQRLHQQTAQYGMQAVKTIECVNAKCLCGDSCLLTHSPSASCIDLVLMISRHLLQCDQPVLPDWIREYVPLLVGLYGAHDVIVKKIRKYFSV